MNGNASDIRFTIMDRMNKKIGLTGFCTSRWITPNQITWFRGMATPIVTGLLATGATYAAFWWYVWVWWLDGLDGSVARQYQRDDIEIAPDDPEFGAYLDAMVDKAQMGWLLATIASFRDQLRRVIPRDYRLSGMVATTILLIIEIILAKVRWTDRGVNRKDDGHRDLRATWPGKIKLVCEVAGGGGFILAMTRDPVWAAWVGVVSLWLAVPLGLMSIGGKLIRRRIQK